MPFRLQEGSQRYEKAGCLKYTEEEGNEGLLVHSWVFCSFCYPQLLVCGGKGGDTGFLAFVVSEVRLALVAGYSEWKSLECGLRLSTYYVLTICGHPFIPSSEHSC